MNTLIKNLVGGMLIVFLFSGTLAVYTLARSLMITSVSKRTFQTQGEGKVVAIPDIARLSLSVLTEGDKDLATLQKDNTAKLNGVIAYLKENGVDQKDIKTQNYSISPRYENRNCSPSTPGTEAAPCPPPQIVGYTINQSIELKVRDLDKAGDIISSAVEKGANSISGPDFTIDDPAALRQQARTQAMEKAHTEAAALAKAGKFSLGNLISVSPSTSRSEAMPMYDSYSSMTAKFAPSPAIEPGSQEIRETVTLTFEIR